MVDDGSIIFGDPSNLKCMLCGRVIKGNPIIYSEFSFDTENCIDTYRKLVGVYGANVSEIGLPSEITSVSLLLYRYSWSIRSIIISQETDRKDRSSEPSYQYV